MGNVCKAARPMEKAAIAILFDFDGTIGNTETPAMEVAFWELAPYLVGAEAKKLEQDKLPWMQDNAGKAFEFMLEDCEKERAAKGLKSIAETRKAKAEPADLVKVVDAARKRFKLPPLHESKYENLLDQQKGETNVALKVLATPCDGIEKLFKELNKIGVPFCICTTSGKPRVPICVESMGFVKYFPPEKIHSGESDFTPSRFKPAPDVYLKGAKTEGYAPQDCVAVEDSVSGVGSASNAGCGFIIGYVGATHIPGEKKESHAKDLLSGRKSKNLKGANIVIRNLSDALPLMKFFLAEREGGRAIDPGTIPKIALGSLKGPYYVAEKPEVKDEY
eukprot:CAMPEP_0170166972 /NCGR_PEP_ID=MMETSP0040_2-20121228/501_1 /TAXON_ID=641309 /ORGANISM="Lotharella oceanica, Strain CCMP622" /LENGTH=333 /DNA_ID=CAMNT_0010404841 /DNA_START=83 /DNA_END=1084 /DNA_ORIENTATION=+